MRTRGKTIINPRAAALARDQTTLSQDAQMVGNGRLIERKFIRKFANAHLVARRRQHRQDCDAMWIGERSEKRCLRLPR